MTAPDIPLADPPSGPAGFRLYSGYLDRNAQLRLVARVLAVLSDAPLYTPRMPRSGRPMSVRMSNCGPLGWYTDRECGYRYVDRHPDTGLPWPDIPEDATALWRDLAGFPLAPEACLINWYGSDARLGMHVDADESARQAPVVSVSLGDTAVFRLGGPHRKDASRTLRLRSGDVVVLGGASRHWYHGVDRVLAGSSRLLADAGYADGGRFNLTLRRVTTPGAGDITHQSGEQCPWP